MQVSTAQAIDLLNQGDVVAIPTETVYGLAGRIDHPEAIQKIFKTKERPFFDPLIVHVCSVQQAKSLVKKFPPIAETLANHFWPGPLTMVLPKKDEIDPMITSGLMDVGIRFPKHDLTLEVIKQTGPLAAPSANKFKKTSPTKAIHVETEFLSQVAVLDGGDCVGGIESTVIGFDQDQILIYRPGLITKEMLEIIVKNFHYKVSYHQSPVAPGQLEHHYMPKVPLFILKHGQKVNLTFSNPKELMLDGNPALAARTLYNQMRDLVDQGADALVVFKKDYHDDDEWRGIWDRITKASTKIL
jgi:L-threonylcarbamoyladenylate synthase